MRYLMMLICSVPLFAWQSGDVSEEYRVNLVELEVKAQDLGRNFISGLSAEDFVVKENGKRMTLDSVEEFQLSRLSDVEAERHRSRVMLVLDYGQTSIPLMSRVFPELRDYLNTLYLGKHEIGLAIKMDGIAEVVGFTRDTQALIEGVDLAESIFRKKRYRALDAPNGYGSISREWRRNYYRRQTEILGQFVRYLGVWSGKKNMVLITENWTIGDDLGETNIDQMDTITLKDIQTACLKNKIAINTLTLTRGEPVRLAAGRQVDLAAATAGFTLRTPYRDLGDRVEQAIYGMEHYYLIRYYSKVDSPRFRNVRVGVKGIAKMARNLGGYFPIDGDLTEQETNATMEMATDFTSDLSFDTDWMFWERYGWGKRRANFVVGQRAYDQTGALVAEKVHPGELFKRKKDEFARMDVKLDLNLPADVNILRIETTVLDLNTGRTIHLSQEPDTAVQI